MDTTTVMQVIKMIDNRILNLSNEYREIVRFIRTVNTEEEAQVEFKDERRLHKARITPLQELREHLQGSLEAELSAVENQSAEQ